MRGTAVRADIFFKVSPTYLLTKYDLSKPGSLLIRMRPSFNTGLYVVRPSMRIYQSLFSQYVQTVVNRSFTNGCYNDQCWLLKRIHRPEHELRVVEMHMCDNNKGRHQECRNTSVGMYHYIPSWEAKWFHRLQADVRHSTCRSER